MRNKKMNKVYEAQALAIAMVILVVSSLIAISVYSRSMKDKGLTLEERASAEALEVSDVILDKLTYFPMQDVITKIGEIGEFDPEVGIVLKEDVDTSDISTLLQSMGSLDGGISISDAISPLCPVRVGGNEYQLTLKEADADTFYEIRPGNVWALPVKNLVSAGACSLTLEMAVRGDSRVGFVLSKLYCNYDAGGNVTGCREYDYEDSLNYCFSDEGSCNNANFLDAAGWNNYPYADSANNKITIPLDVVLDTYTLSEVRVKAVGGTVGLNYSLSEGCATGLRMYQLRATANCSGVYRGKEVLIPEAKWHNPLFDYVLFNGQGSL